MTGLAQINRAWFSLHPHTAPSSMIRSTTSACLHSSLFLHSRWSSSSRDDIQVLSGFHARSEWTAGPFRSVPRVSVSVLSILAHSSPPSIYLTRGDLLPVPSTEGLQGITATDLRFTERRWVSSHPILAAASTSLTSCVQPFLPTTNPHHIPAHHTIFIWIFTSCKFILIFPNKL